jgi:hypothetical protein
MVMMILSNKMYKFWRQGIGVYFLLLKFPQNHTIFEEKTNHEGAG